MLPLDKYMPLVKQWAKDKNWPMMKQSATKRLDAMGIVDLGLGSWHRFMYKEWFDKAKEEGIIALNSYKQWVPYVVMDEENEIIGMHGKTPIYSKNSKKSKISKESINKLAEFDERYKKWMYAQKQMVLEIDGLIKQYEKDISPIDTVSPL